MKQFINLENKNILVVGASSGIGRQTAISLTEYGANVSIVARREDMLKETMSMLQGNKNRSYSFDVSNIDDIGDIIKNAALESGPFDGMVYSAGISIERPLGVCKPETTEKMLRVNFEAFYEIVRQLTKKKNCSDGCSIVGISSASAINAEKSLSIYGASKAAMDASVRVLAKELAPKNIRINTIRPGFIRTAMYDEYVKNYGDEGIEKINATHPLGLGEPEDIANAAIFLLSDASKYITGVHLSVDGGWSCM